jgi:hypothetical protein
MSEKIDRENDPRWDVLDAYVREIAERMGLVLYPYRILREPPPADAAAKVEYSFQTLFFEISFADSFFSCSPSRQRHVVVHELCHVIESSRMGCIDAMRIQSFVSVDFYNHWYEHYNRERERMIDWMAHLIAPQYPIPSLEQATGGIGE